MKIPTTVVTGFLGAGKTTLVRHVLENADGKRIALIVKSSGPRHRPFHFELRIEDRGDDNMIELPTAAFAARSPTISCRPWKP